MLQHAHAQGTHVHTSQLFDEVTSAARALVTDGQGFVVARSFSKFFVKGDKLSYKPINPASFTVQEKLDGSLGVLFHFHSAWHICSRASFTSPQAQVATALLRERCSTEHLDPSVAYSFELIHPNNRIVVDYGDRCELVILAAFRPDGSEVFPLPQEVQRCGLPIVRSFTGAEFAKVEALKALAWADAEGFVVRFADGGRLKIKFAAYLAAHSTAQGATVPNLMQAFADSLQIDDAESANNALHEVAPWVRLY